MIGKLIGAALGRRLAGEDHKGRGELIGFVAPALAKRVGTPLLVLAGAGWAAKKLLDRRRSRRATAV